LAEVHITPEEQKCIRIIAKMYRDGIIQLSQEKLREALTADSVHVDDAGFHLLIRMMEQYGVIESWATDGPFIVRGHTITAGSVQLERAIDQQFHDAEKGDIVAQVTEKARSHPVLAWFIIAFFILTMTATFLNQTMGVLQSLGVMAKPSATQK
jgi:hypothetical protein